MSPIDLTANDTNLEESLLFKKRSYKDRFVGYDQQAKYYAGSDVLVYFNTVWVPEITSIQFTAGPKDAPVFSYSHEHFNAVTKGTYIVSGQITMNFIETGYLNKVMRTVWNDLLDVSFFTNISDKIESNDRFAQSVDTLLTDKRRSATFADVEQSKKEMKDKLWGKSKSSTTDRQQPLYRPDHLTSTKTFTDTDANGKSVIKTIPPINLMILYGNPQGVHEVKKLTDIRFLEYSQTINNDGTPIQEIYSFIARDMDNPEDITGISPLSVHNVATNINTKALTHFMADCLFAYIVRTSSFAINYDHKCLINKDALMVARNHDAGYFVYQGKDHVSLSITHGFTFPISFLKEHKLAPYGDLPEKNTNVLRAQALLYIINNEKDVEAAKFYETKPSSLLPQNMAVAASSMAYISALLDRISFMNPYVSAKSTKVISRFQPKDYTVVESGLADSPILSKSDFDYNAMIDHQINNAHFVYEKFLVNTDEYDAKEFTTNAEIIGKSAIIDPLDSSNSPSVFVGVTNQNTPHRIFELVKASTPINDNDRASGQVHMLSSLSAGLDTIPAIPSSTTDPMGGIKSVYFLPEDYAKDGVILYDPAQRPMGSYIRPITTVGIGFDYVVQYRDAQGNSSSDLPIPIALKNKKIAVDCVVFIDDSPGYYLNGKHEKTPAYTFVQNINAGTFQLTLTKITRAITPDSTIKIALIDPSINKITNHATYFTSQRYNDFKSNYYLRYDLYKYNSATNKYLKEPIQQLLDVLNERIIGARFAALGALNIHSYIISPFTGNYIKKYINRMVVYTTNYQYKFSFQHFCDRFIKDLQDYKINATAKNSSRPFAEINVEFIRDVFRKRFLQNYDNYIIPGNVEIKLLGPAKQYVLVSGKYNIPSHDLVKSLIKSTTGQVAPKSNVLTMNYAVIDIDHTGNKTPMAIALNLPGLSCRSNYIYRICSAPTNAPHSLLQNKNIDQMGISTIISSPNKAITIPDEIIIPESKDPPSEEQTTRWAILKKEFEVLDNVILDYAYEGAIHNIRGTLYINQPEANVGEAGAPMTTEGNILLVNTVTTNAAYTLADLVNEVSTNGDPMDHSKYLTADIFETKKRLGGGLEGYDQTITSFKKMFGEKGLDKIYGKTTNEGSASDPNTAEPKQMVYVAVRSLLHALYELKASIVLIKKLGTATWHNLI